jgi:hypothetical protein
MIELGYDLPMKRVFLAIWIALVLTVAVAPVGFELNDNRLTANASVALAACLPGQVELSVAFTKGGSTCVAPDANGGVIVTYLKMVLKFLSAGVGVVILLMLTIAGIQYITASGQPEQVKAAKTRITNAITGLVLFLIAFAVLNLIIPGSIFG